MKSIFKVNKKVLPAGLAAALMRHQVCPIVVLRAKAAGATIVNRSSGGLTGSRIAGLLGRVPVEAVEMLESLTED